MIKNEFCSYLRKKGLFRSFLYLVQIDYTLGNKRRIASNILEGILVYRKDCSRCMRPSFSSSEIGEWICPICGKDLTDAPFFHAITLEKAAVGRAWRKDPYKKQDNRTDTGFYGGKI